MRYGRSTYLGGWSYTIDSDNAYCDIVEVTNDENKDMVLKYITIYLGVGAYGYTANAPHIATGTGQPVTLHLSTNYSYDENASNSVYVDSPVNGTVYAYSDSSGSHYTFRIINMQQYTFTFPNDGILMSSGTSLRFFYRFDSAKNVILCPRDTQSYGGVYYYVGGYAVSPYSEPTEYHIIPRDYIMRADKSNYLADYSLKCGREGTIMWANEEIYPYSSTWSYGKVSDIPSSILNSKIYSGQILGSTGTSSSSGPVYVNLSSCSAGSRYRLAIQFSDNHYNFLSGDNQVFYTYTKPVINSASITSKFSPQDTPKLKWNTNSRTWASKEDNFTTTITSNSKSLNNVSQLPISSNDTSISSSSEYKITDSIINYLFNANERSVNSISDSFVIVRENTSAKIGTSDRYIASSTVNYKIQYQPVKLPTNGNVVNSSGINISGHTITIQEVPTIKLTWTYPISSGAAGVVNGYIVRIYSDSSLTNQVGNDKVVAVSTNGGAGVLNINTSTELKRGVMNYATITPYYTKPNGQGRIEGTNRLKLTLVKPISKLNPPTIEYPTDNGDWHNKYFRILMQLPQDDDLSNLINDGTINNESEYRYNAIQLEITPVGQSAITYTFNNTSIWSKISPLHKDKIAVAPGLLSGFPNVSSYKYRVRIQKKYYEAKWSEWTTERTIKNTSLTKLSLTSGRKILATDYKYLYDNVMRLWNTYPIGNYDSELNSAIARGIIIKFNEYRGAYKSIKKLKENINNYCTYTNTDVKLNRDIEDLTINPTKSGEEITAANIDSSGRNYLNIIIDDMNELY